MRIREEDADLDEAKTLKVSLPARLHLKLHTLKILTGDTISATVEEALVAHLKGMDQVSVDPDAQAAAEGSAA